MIEKEKSERKHQSKGADVVKNKRLGQKSIGEMLTIRISNQFLLNAPKIQKTVFRKAMIQRGML